MKAIKVHEFGAPEVLCREEVEQPTVGAGQLPLWTNVDLLKAEGGYREDVY